MLPERGVVSGEPRSFAGIEASAAEHPGQGIGQQAEDAADELVGRRVGGLYGKLAGQVGEELVRRKTPLIEDLFQRRAAHVADGLEGVGEQVFHLAGGVRRRGDVGQRRPRDAVVPAAGGFQLLQLQPLLDVFFGNADVLAEIVGLRFQQLVVVCLLQPKLSGLLVQVPVKLGSGLRVLDLRFLFLGGSVFVDLGGDSSLRHAEGKQLAGKVVRLPVQLHLVDGPPVP